MIQSPGIRLVEYLYLFYNENALQPLCCIITQQFSWATAFNLTRYSTHQQSNIEMGGLLDGFGPVGADIEAFWP